MHEADEWEEERRCIDSLSAEVLDEGPVGSAAALHDRLPNQIRLPTPALQPLRLLL